MMLRKVLLAVGLLNAAAASAAPPPADPSVLPLFQRTCLAGEFTRAAREGAIASDSGWVAADATGLKFQELGTVKSLSAIYDFKKPQDVKVWKRSIYGKEVRAVIASYDTKRSGYSTVCALLVPGVKNGIAYFDGFRELMRSVGLKGKSVDLPHYVEFAGRLADGRRARGDLFSRSQVTGERETMHLYIAF